MKYVIRIFFILVILSIGIYFMYYTIHLNQISKQLDRIKQETEQLDAEVQQIYKENADLFNELDNNEGEIVYELRTN